MHKHIQSVKWKECNRVAAAADPNEFASRMRTISEQAERKMVAMKKKEKWLVALHTCTLVSGATDNDDDGACVLVCVRARMCV